MRDERSESLLMSKAQRRTQPRVHLPTKVHWVQLGEERLAEGDFLANYDPNDFKRITYMPDDLTLTACHPEIFGRRADKMAQALTDVRNKRGKRDTESLNIGMEIAHNKILEQLTAEELDLENKVRKRRRKRGLKTTYMDVLMAKVRKMVKDQEKGLSRKFVPRPFREYQLHFWRPIGLIQVD